MHKLKRLFEKRKNSYKELVEIRKKKNKTKYEKLVFRQEIEDDNNYMPTLSSYCSRFTIHSFSALLLMAS